jgi:hypothetical protein
MNITRGFASVFTVLGGAGLVAGVGRGQPFDPLRPQTVVVGLPSSGARVDRIDAARSGLSRTALPTSELQTSWRRSLGFPIELAPLVDGEGGVFITGARGDVVALSSTGEERWRSLTFAQRPGPAALLSDGALVFADSTGQAWAVAGGIVRWHTFFGRPGTSHPAPLALEDGGVIVATSHEIAMLDASGQQRARTTLPEAVTGPLLSALGRVVFLTASGSVWTWAPGAPEPARIGRFDASVDGGAVLADDHTLVGLTAGRTKLSAFDLVQGVCSVRATAMGGHWLGPPALHGTTTYMRFVSAGADSAVALDESGSEVGRALIGTHAPQPNDGGPNGGVGMTSPLLVDPFGTIAFATSTGSVGVVADLTHPEAVVDLVANACPTSLEGVGQGEGPVAGLAPLVSDALVVACRSGTVFAIQHRKDRPTLHAPHAAGH